MGADLRRRLATLVYSGSRRRARCREERTRPVLQCAPVAALPAGGEATSGSDNLVYFMALESRSRAFSIRTTIPAGLTLSRVPASAHSQCECAMCERAVTLVSHSSGRS